MSVAQIYHQNLQVGICEEELRLNEMKLERKVTEEKDGENL